MAHIVRRPHGWVACRARLDQRPGRRSPAPALGAGAGRLHGESQRLGVVEHGAHRDVHQRCFPASSWERKIRRMRHTVVTDGSHPLPVQHVGAGVDLQLWWVDVDVEVVVRATVGAGRKTARGPHRGDLLALRSALSPSAAAGRSPSSRSEPRAVRRRCDQRTQRRRRRRDADANPAHGLEAIQHRRRRHRPEELAEHDVGRFARSSWATSGKRRITSWGVMGSRPGIGITSITCTATESAASSGSAHRTS